MTRAIRRKSGTSSYRINQVDHLERRELLTASVATTTHITLIPAHVEVTNKAVHAEVVKHTTKVHAAETKAPVKASAVVSKHTTTTAKHTTTTVKKTAAKAPVNLLSSTLVVRRSLSSNSPVPGALTPLQVETAYSVTSLGITNEGQGQTIGIVDEYNDPNILNDANVFSREYNLPLFGSAGGPALTVYKDAALGAVINSPSPASGGDVTIETSLDVEWAHAMAPKANILLVEVPATGSNANVFAELLHGVQYAAGHGASTVSLSYGYPETYIGLPSLYTENQTYLATGAATNVAVTISSGDYTLPLFPSTSPNVIAVGGTALHLNSSGQYSYETAWGGSATSGAGGGGTSAFYYTPTYQSSNGVSFNEFRATPDVALVADPYTGVSVYDSYSTNSASPWNVIGGTSLASPLFAGIIALAQQDRATAGKAALTSVQINTADYDLYSSPNYLTYFHDVTIGSNNDYGSGYPYYNAVTGYDRATGIGSPIAQTLVPYLASL